MDNVGGRCVVIGVSVGYCSFNHVICRLCYRCSVILCGGRVVVRHGVVVMGEVSYFV